MFHPGGGASHQPNMDTSDRQKEASQDRIRAAENRLQRLRELIERRTRAGFDTSEGWRLFRLTANALANMRQSDALLDILHRGGRLRGGAAEPYAPLAALNGAERVAFNPGAVIQAAEQEPHDCHIIESGIASLCFGDADGIEVGMVGPGGIVGISALLAGDPVPVAAVATTRCSTVAIALPELASRIGGDVK